MEATERSLQRIPTFMKFDLSVVDLQEPGLEFSGSSTVRHMTSGSPWQRGACSDRTSNPNRSAGQSAIDVQPGGGGGGGGGALGYLGGCTRSLSKLKNTPKALISGQKSTLILIKR